MPCSWTLSAEFMMSNLSAVLLCRINYVPDFGCTLQERVPPRGLACCDIVCVGSGQKKKPLFVSLPPYEKTSLCFFCDLRYKRRGFVSTRTPHQCWCVCGLEKSTRTAEEEEKPLLPAMVISHSKGCTAAFRPSDYPHKHNGTSETKRRQSFQKARSVHATT